MVTTMFFSCPQCIHDDHLWANVFFHGWKAVDAECPSCHKTESCWQAYDVPGWCGVRYSLKDGHPTPTFYGSSEIEWHYAMENGAGGCGECDSEFPVSNFKSFTVNEHSKDYDRHNIEFEQECSCNFCEWEGRPNQLVLIDANGESLPVPGPGQLQLEI